MKRVRIPKVPSLQHLARVWDPDPKRIAHTLVALAKNGPTFSYQLIYELVGDLIISKIPYEQVESAVKMKVKRESVRENFLELLPLIRDQLSGVDASFFHQVSPRYYPIGRGLAVPFAPPFVYGLDGTIHLPWLSFWKRNPLAGDRLGLFISIVDQILGQDPDLEEANVSILDFSAPERSEARRVTVISSEEIPRMSRESVFSMLSVFVSGYEMACEELLSSADFSERLDRQRDTLDLDQLDLFE